uniref:Hypothetical secreted protein n=1 Tax=Simulium guianense TaxID=445764 RepID=F5GTU2_SIMGU
MLLSSIVVLFGLCGTISANAIDPKIDIKAKLVDELKKMGVTMDKYCDFQLDEGTFNTSVTIAKGNAKQHVQQLMQEIEPRRKNIDGQVKALLEQANSEVKVESLVADLVDFAKTVLVNELQILRNFALWIAADKAKVPSNTKCGAKEHGEQINNDMILGCGTGELELDANKICRSMVQFQVGLNRINECQADHKSCDETKVSRHRPKSGLTGILSRKTDSF